MLIPVMLMRVSNSSTEPPHWLFASKEESLSVSTLERQQEGESRNTDFHKKLISDLD